MHSEPHPAPPLWVVTGPTASGKTAMAVEIAARTGREVLSMDSMAVYRQMDIGTAKPTAEERARVPHHLIDLVAPQDTFDTARWCEEAAMRLDELQRRGVGALFVGGTPLYLMAFFKGMMEGPESDPALRAALEAREHAEPGALHAELQARDPAAAARIHRNDLRRLVRALEVLEQTGRTISSQQDHFERDGWLRPCRVVVVERDRDDLHARVKQRTERMLDDGLLTETEAIERQGGFSRTAGAAIGYAECREFLRGRFKDRTELRNRIRRNTHQLIRRQSTWLRRLAEAATVPAAAGADAVQRALETSSAELQ
ncbi:MAG: tRNA (adenosine(37)-N6)-dimethylallyltransferase MiaA [Planctomycetes bacterium]|nr:tRNA (adenosine(37)-N6)-dimethylallyltransferase MiaA [Planctomycetota bacterium]